MTTEDCDAFPLNQTAANFLISIKIDISLLTLYSIYVSLLKAALHG